MLNTKFNFYYNKLEKLHQVFVSKYKYNMNKNMNNKPEYNMSSTKDKLLSICADIGIKNCKSKNKTELIKLIDAS